MAAGNSEKKYEQVENVLEQKERAFLTTRIREQSRYIVYIRKYNSGLALIKIAAEYSFVWKEAKERKRRRCSVGCLRSFSLTHHTMPAYNLKCCIGEYNKEKSDSNGFVQVDNDVIQAIMSMRASTRAKIVYINRKYHALC